MKIFQGIRHTVWMAFNLLLLSALLLADVSVLLPPGRAPLAAVLGIGFPWLVLANALVAFSWLFTSRKSWSVLGVLALLLSVPNSLRTWSFLPPQEPSGRPSLTILTYNTHMCQLVTKTPKNDILRYIRESGADVVCLQEYDVRKNAAYLTFSEARAYLTKVYPYTYYDFIVHDSRRQYGTAVYSKYPLIHKHTVPYESRGNISSCCDIVVDADTIRLINNHLESNAFRAHELSSDSLQLVYEKLGRASRKREAEARAVRQEIDASPYPVIICGDFNDVPVSYTYRTIRGRDLQDAFLATSRWKRGATFQHLRVGVRIDYVFTSPTLRPVQTRVDTVSYSDHYPLLATIEL